MKSIVKAHRKARYELDVEYVVKITNIIIPLLQAGKKDAVLELITTYSTGSADLIYNLSVLDITNQTNINHFAGLVALEMLEIRH